MDEKKMARLTEAVIERLSRPRVGLLWPGTGGPLACPDGAVSWINYGSGFCGPRTYDLESLARPDLEHRSLHLLVLFAASPALIAELVSGIWVSKAACLAGGALGRIPLLIESSALRSYYASAPEPARQSLIAALARLAEKGASDFLASSWPAGSGGSPSAAQSAGFGSDEGKERAKDSVAVNSAAPSTAASGHAASGPATCDPVARRAIIEASGWLTWQDVAPFVRGINELVIPAGTRLTPEVHDRLATLGICVVAR